MPTLRLMLFVLLDCSDPGQCTCTYVMIQSYPFIKPVRSSAYISHGKAPLGDSTACSSYISSACDLGTMVGPGAVTTKF